MNSRERLMAIFQNKEIDRPALKLWGLTPGQRLIHPSYLPIYELALETTDYMITASSPYDTILGINANKITEKHIAAGPSSEWEDITTILHTPMGDLKSIYRNSTNGRPGYDLEHFGKKEREIEALLSIPYEPFPLNLSSYEKMDKLVGDRGICMYGLDNAIYALHRIIGSETMAFLSFENPQLLHRALEEFSKRIRFEVDRVFDAGIKPIFGWVGPEVCIPPLMSPASFEAYVMNFDKPLCDYIHDRGGYVWLHCHGKVSHLVDRFINMGIDVLNPLEPPPMGDVIVSELVAKYGNSIGFEGNIETHDLWSADTDMISDLVVSTVKEGSKSGRFILCPSAGYMEFPNPTKKYIDNLMAYLKTGYSEAVKCR